MNNKTSKVWCQRDRPAVKNTCCLVLRTHMVAHNHLCNFSSRGSTPLVSQIHQSFVQCTYICAGIHSYTYKICLLQPNSTDALYLVK